MGTRYEIGPDSEKAISIMEEYVTVMQKNVGDVFEEIKDLVSKQDYKVLFNVAKDLELTYNEQVLKIIHDKINEWAEGEFGLANYAASQGFHDETVEEAKRQQSRLVDAVNSMVPINCISEIKSPSKEQITELIKEGLENISLHAKNLESIVDEKDAQLKSLSEENEFVKMIVVFGKIFGNSLYSFISNITKQMQQILNDDLDTIARKQKEKEEAADEFAKKAEQNVEDTCEKLTNKFSKYFNK